MNAQMAQLMQQLGGGQFAAPASLVEFKAGRMDYDGRMVTPDRRKGLIKVTKDDQGMKTFSFCDADTGNPIENFYIFPDSAKFEKVK